MQGLVLGLTIWDGGGGGGCLVDVCDAASGVDEAVPVGRRVARVTDEVDEGVGQRSPTDLVHQSQPGLQVVD